jgi:hypothetical protein
VERINTRLEARALGAIDFNKKALILKFFAHILLPGKERRNKYAIVLAQGYTRACRTQRIDNIS